MEIYEYLRGLCGHNHMVAEFHIHIQSVLRMEKKIHMLPPNILEKEKIVGWEAKLFLNYF